MEKTKQSYRNEIPVQLAPASFFFERQGQHLLLAIVLIAGGWQLSAHSLQGDAWLGISDIHWLLLSLIVPLIQQFLGWFVFRSQLCFLLLSRLFGRFDIAVWALFFLPLLIARPVLQIGLGISNQGTLPIPPLIAWLLGILLLIPAMYALYSVIRYFGLVRALGGDHFREKFRQMPFVKQGAYRWSDNVMYGLVFLGLWSIALFTRSQAALGMALFQHAYIWVHMYCTEEPDMDWIYQSAINKED